MKQSTKISLLLTAVVLISLGLGFLGGTYYFKQMPRQMQLDAGKNKINTILEIIDQQYVDTVNMGQLIDRTASSLISELDPHSVLIPVEDMQLVADDLEGSFSGIGVSFNMSTDTIVIISVISNGPAEKVGILPFDRIVSIDDSIVAGKEISQMKIMRTLRGAKNTKVKLGIQRGTSTELIQIEVTRGDVPNYSIDVAYPINNIGYIKVKSFSKTTYNEFLTSIAKLRKASCNSFIVDMRGNSGGVMEAAIRMINEFLPARSSIVYTEGKAFPRQNFFADGSGTCQDVPIIVLTDELSGSASEIFAGAIQDNDRGLIIGRRTYGKGLVQAPIPLKDGSQLRLTIARYHTPSGRCIQKVYEMGKSDEYEMDLQNRYEHGEFDSADSIKMDESLAFKTKMGRTVYGGGGIMPDIFIPRDTSLITSYYSNIVNTGTLYQFTLDYSDRNKTQLSAFKTYQELHAYLQQQPILYELVSYAESKGIKRRPTLIETSRKLIENNIYSYIVRNFFDYEGFYPIYLQDDATLQRAIQEINNGTWRPDGSLGAQLLLNEKERNLINRTSYQTDRIAKKTSVETVNPIL